MHFVDLFSMKIVYNFIVFLYELSIYLYILRFILRCFQAKGACVGDVFLATDVAFHDRRIPIPVSFSCIQFSSFWYLVNVARHLEEWLSMNLSLICTMEHKGDIQIAEVVKFSSIHLFKQNLSWMFLWCVTRVQI